MEKEIAKELALIREQMYDIKKTVGTYYDLVTDALKKFDADIAGGANSELYGKQLNLAMQRFVGSQEYDDTAAMQLTELYPAWEMRLLFMEECKEGEILRYSENEDGETQLWRVLQTHTPQEDWTPASAPSLFKAIGIAPDDIPVWSQPLGQEDAYQKGDKVHYPDASSDVYESKIDHNVWSPEAFPEGWSKV